MAKIFNGKILFANAIQPTGAQPLDDRVVVQSYSDLVDVATFGDAKYLGMIVSVVDDSKLYMLTNTDVTAAGAWKEIGASGDVDGDVTELITKVSSLESTVGNAESGLVKDVADLKDAMEALPETFVTDVKVGETSLVAEGVADLSNFVQKDGDKVLSTNDYTTDEKNKLANIAAGAEVNYVKSVGDNLNVDAEGKLTVTIPEVEVPFQFVAADDKVLKLEAGVLSSGLSYDREEVEGVDSLVLKGLDGAVIGSVPVADFVADGMLESVTPVEGTTKFKFTFKKTNGSTEDFEVDFGKFVDTYHADNTTLELDSTSNTFKVKDGVFEAAGAAAGVKSEIETELADYAKSADVYSKTDADSTFVKFDDYVAYTQDEKDKLASIATSAEVNVLEGVQVNGTDLSISDKKVNIDLSAYALSATVDGSLAKKVDVVEGKGLSSNDFTNELKTKLEGIATGAEVNVVKEVDTTGVLGLDDSGKLSADLSAYATSTALTAKLDASAKVNGISFVNGEATLDAGDIALEAAITRTENGEQKNVYEATSSIQSVLAGLSARIDTLDPNISGEFGVSAITAGNGIEVSGASSTPTISVKASAIEGNIAEVKTDGIYVATPEVPDMRSYWEDI